MGTCKRRRPVEPSPLSTCDSMRKIVVVYFIIQIFSYPLAPFCSGVGQVEEAFATLQTWQGVAAGLPALVDRLRALESLHLASASFAQRLEQVTHATFSYVRGVQSCTHVVRFCSEGRSERGRRARVRRIYRNTLSRVHV